MRYPEEYPTVVKSWNENSLVYTILTVYVSGYGHYCGYVRFPQCPMKVEHSYHGILTYAPVHGSISYAKQDEDGTMVYGFDCNHDGDHTNSKYKDIEWLTRECENMSKSITEAAKFEELYLNTQDDDRVKVISDYHKKLMADYGIKFDICDNTCAALNFLFGIP